ncbi:hypothetical protein CSKR_102511 [Clonorchis sinensis]|uniref:Uncharacterized protein n=1 Tax=Clonorchis sinensis TaxID=79923 RepID=A0A8T1M3Y6_CLOSI|nr:hypothetical protein CSKR_102511 [Clonorchis sinensis]
MLHQLQCELEEINTRFMQYTEKAKRLFGHQDYLPLNSVIEALKEDMHSLKLSYEKQLHNLICSVEELKNKIKDLEREVCNKTNENARLADRISLEASKNAKLLLEISELKTVLLRKDQQLLSFNSSLSTGFCERDNISNHDMKLYTSVDRTQRKRRSAEFLRHSISHKSTHAETIIELLGPLVEKFITSEESCTDIISVQNEIRKLQSLLENEEYRLNSIENFHQVVANENHDTLSGNRKRKQNFMARDFYRTAVALQISEINPQGRFVKIHNADSELLAQLCGLSETKDDGVVRSYKVTSEECSCTTIGLPTTIPKKSGDSQTGSREIPDLFHKIKKNSLTQQVPKFKSAYYSTNQARN